jgi:hypothetical protein
MKVNIQFDCDNDAFQGQMFRSEVLKVLHQALKKTVEMHPTGGSSKLRDSNGNTVGTVEVVET